MSPSVTAPPPRRILITGGAGCLGSALTNHYLHGGDAVLVLDTFATGRRESLPDHHPGLRVVTGSVADRKLVDDCFAGFAPTHVIHSAASYKNPDDWREDVRTNVEGTIAVVEAARRTGVRRLVHFQTALCYGRPRVVPVPVDHPVQPFTSYGISKTAGEQYLMLAGLPAVSLRLASVIGPGLAIGPIPTFYKRLKAGQPCFCSAAVRDMLAMEDFLDVMALVMADDAPTGLFNVSTGTGHSITALFEIVAAHLGLATDRPVPVVPVASDDVPVMVLDPAETEARLGWRARRALEPTVRALLDWYDAHGVGTVHSHLTAAPAAARPGAQRS
jgi:UDP-glucose 4-epimerase